MSSEVSMLIQLVLANGKVTENHRPDAFIFDQALAKCMKKVVTVTTSEADLDLSDLTTEGLLYLYCTDATNYVEWGLNVSAALEEGFLLKKNFPSVVHVKPGKTIRWKAIGGSCEVLVIAFNN